MRAIIDTHIFLWYIATPERISARAKAVIADGNNEVFLSIASAGEIVLKKMTGKLKLPSPAAAYVQRQAANHGIRILPILAGHLESLETLLPYHRDPFDRMVIAQAIHEKLPLITVDSQLRKYSVEVIW